MKRQKVTTELDERLNLGTSIGCAVIPALFLSAMICALLKWDFFAGMILTAVIACPLVIFMDSIMSSKTKK